MENDGGIWIDSEAWLKKSREANDLRAVGIAADMLAALTVGATQAFKFDADVISKLVSNAAETVTPDEVLRLKDKLLLFFVELPDGRWAPSPEIFSATDPNQGEDDEGRNEAN
jgi:hypothetical protein